VNFIGLGSFLRECWKTGYLLTAEAAAVVGASVRNGGLYTRFKSKVLSPRT